ncbi:Alanine racemase [Acididesulfobacillus acetoxydans]|uniref:Alanine racemase n=1 Tax=Acididesulfobacillus acetoxydans TaxID=1561005 RepID=A0A8S0XB27_9FIRM|nr:alanine racemase [Acididesulfobacillus acetoxydans]CAA7600686.1 Alanine racemase [Acididesulfobacillus acetoxydans]CEJ09467.1 Alanine racemase [Acididesulfobacillus acetoxydans]
MEFMRPVWAEINLAALRRNYARVQSYTHAEMMPIVKANAYGHGALPVAGALRALGAKRFGVALLEEALEIKQAYPDLTLMVIGTTPEEASDVLVREDIIPGISRLSQAAALSAAAVRQERVARLHVKVDTGMGRIGFRHEDAASILEIAALPNLRIEGIYTHFAAADQQDLSFAHEQLDRFNRIYSRLRAQGLSIPLRHAANSAAILRLPEAHFELVRPGIVLYGLPPSRQVGPEAELEPVLSWKTKITHLKMIAQGETVSYGRTFCAAYPTRVATIPVGYADGLRRALSNRGEALIRGRRVPMIGRICMDQTLLDVTKLPAAEVGDVVTLIGADGSDRLEATEMAEVLKTINYEIVCGISGRVPRVYAEN